MVRTNKQTEIPNCIHCGFETINTLDKAFKKKREPA